MRLLGPRAHNFLSFSQNYFNHGRVFVCAFSYFHSFGGRFHVVEVYHVALSLGDGYVSDDNNIVVLDGRILFFGLSTNKLTQSCRPS